jgi:WD40 repeat protein
MTHDNFDNLEDGVRRLLERLGKEHRRYMETLTLQSRLEENLNDIRVYGDDENRRTDRARIMEQLNRLALETTETSFNALCNKRKSRISLANTVNIRELLEAMGYRITDVRSEGDDAYFLCEVKWGVEICQEVVHFVSTKPTPGDIAALSDVVISNDLTRGVLLSRQSLPETLKKLVKQRSHIRFHTLDEFINHLADFRPYLDNLIKEHEASEILNYYVPLTVKSERAADLTPEIFKPLTTFVDTWANEAGRNHLSILGDFGSGKTWFCQHYAYLAAKRYLADSTHHRIPILISLRNYSRAYDVEQLITDAIANRYGIALASGYKTFATLNKAGRLLIIFDGFDEMERRISDYRTTVENFWELAKVVNQSSKVLLTCRTAYFRHRREQEKTLAPKQSQVSVTAGEHMIDLHGQDCFEVVYLQEFDDQDIKASIQKRISVGWEPVHKEIMRLANLRDLASRPVLLDMIVRTLPEIEEISQTNQATLYESYVNALLKRRWNEDTDYVHPEDRLLFVQELAWEMYRKQKLTIPFSEFPEWVADYFGFKNNPERAAFFDRDLRTQSYLVRDEAGNYRFAHKSFMEYFAARKMAEVISEPKFDVQSAVHIWGIQPVTDEILEFLLQMNLSKSALWQLLENSRGRSFSQVKYSTGNATRVLSAQSSTMYLDFGLDFSNMVLVGADFTGQILKEANFKDASLTNADLTAADLSGSNLQRANLRGARLTFTNLVSADMRFADLSDVNLRELDQVRDIAFSPDGGIIGVAAANQVRLIDLTNGDNLGFAMHSSYFRCIAFDPTGQFLIAGAADGFVKIWETDSLSEMLSVQPLNSVYSIALDPKGEEVFIGGEGRDCIVLSYPDGKPKLTPECNLRGEVRSSLYTSAGDIIIIGAQKSPNIAVLNRYTGKEIRNIELVDSSVMSLDLDPDTDRLACGSSNGCIYIFDFNTGKMLKQWSVEKKTDRNRWIWDIRYTDNGEILISDGPRHTVAIWDADTGKTISLLSGHTRRLAAVVLDPSSTYIASGGVDGTVRIWDISSQSESRVFRQRMDCSDLKIGGIQTSNESLTKFLIERGAIVE